MKYQILQTAKSIVESLHIAHQTNDYSHSTLYKAFKPLIPSFEKIIYGKGFFPGQKIDHVHVSTPVYKDDLGNIIYRTWNNTSKETTPCINLPNSGNFEDHIKSISDKKINRWEKIRIDTSMDYEVILPDGTIHKPIQHISQSYFTPTPQFNVQQLLCDLDFLGLTAHPNYSLLDSFVAVVCIGLYTFFKYSDHILVMSSAGVPIKVDLLHWGTILNVDPYDLDSIKKLLLILNPSLDVTNLIILDEAHRSYELMRCLKDLGVDASDFEKILDGFVHHHNNNLSYTYGRLICR